MNLRVVLLKKTALLHKDQYALNPGFGWEVLGPWVTMGHFDCMYSYLQDTKNRNIFTVIHENNNEIVKKNDGNCYFHPLYLLSEDSDEALWSYDSWFMSVTRIHLPSTVVDFDSIDRLKADIVQQCEKANCRCHIYQTVELSDLVLIVKSNQINTMLDTILNLWSHPDVGKIYTYCGIDYGHMINQDVLPEVNDDIGFLSMRFAVRDSAKVGVFFEYIENKLGAKPFYSIAGVDDVIVNFQDLEVGRLVRLFKSWLVQGLPESIDLNGAFSDITTRLGASFRNLYQQLDKEIPAACEMETGETLQAQCWELVRLNNYVEKLMVEHGISQVDWYWMRSLTELSRSLLRLSRNVLLDEFVYLMLPGIWSFLYNLKELLSNGTSDSLSTLDQEVCCRFVDHCAHLMEHVMRTEGQLTHHPEIRPILYDIPLAMLEHILAFLNLCSTILQAMDDPKKQIQFILLPGLCSEMKTEEIFTANSNLPGLLAISIPLHLMYETQTVQIALCHEISHFVGEKHRNREQREKCYIGASAELIADLIFETERQSFVEQIRRRIEIHISNCQNKSTWTIMDYAQEVQNWIDDFLYNENLPGTYGKLIRDILKSEASGGSDLENPPLQLHADFDNLRMRNINYFSQILPVFTMLFREVFADICMVRLLDLNADTYLNAFYGDISENPTSAEFYAVRVYTTLTTVGKDIPKKCGATDTAEKFHSALQRLKYRGARRDMESGDYQFPFGCVSRLLDYTNGCMGKIEELLNNEDIGQLRRMYKNVSDPDMDHRELQKFIQEYRKRYLHVRLPWQQTQ